MASGSWRLGFFVPIQTRMRLNAPYRLPRLPRNHHRSSRLRLGPHQYRQRHGRFQSLPVLTPPRNGRGNQSANRTQTVNSNSPQWPSKKQGKQWKYIHVEAFKSTAEKRVLWPNHVSPFLLALFFAKCAKAAISRALSEKKRKEKGEGRGGHVPPQKTQSVCFKHI